LIAPLVPLRSKLDRLDPGTALEKTAALSTELRALGRGVGPRGGLGPVPTGRAAAETTRPLGGDNDGRRPWVALVRAERFFPSREQRATVEP